MHFVATDKELYSATLNNFLGTEPVILRNLGQQHYSMKSEYLPAWLNGEWKGGREYEEGNSDRNGNGGKMNVQISLEITKEAEMCKRTSKKWNKLQETASAKGLFCFPERGNVWDTRGEMGRHEDEVTAGEMGDERRNSVRGNGGWKGSEEGHTDEAEVCFKFKLISLKKHTCNEAILALI